MIIIGGFLLLLILLFQIPIEVFSPVIGIILFVLILGIRDLKSRIVIEQDGITRVSPMASIKIKWTDIIKIKYKPLRKNLILFDKDGKKLMFYNSIINLRELQQKINHQIYTSVLQPKILHNAMLTADVVIGAI